MSSRGCIRSCAFCSEHLLHKKFRAFPVKNIIEQIAVLRERGIQYFIFNDSLINGDLGAFESLLDAIISAYGAIHWEAQIAVRDDMPETLFEKIKKSGCYNLFIGLESACNKTLQQMRKGFTRETALRFFKQLKNHRLRFGVSVIIGFPGETDADFAETLEFLKEHRDIIEKIEQVNPYVYYAGTTAGAKRGAAERSFEKTDIFVESLRKEGFKFTNAFIKNLVAR